MEQNWKRKRPFKAPTVRRTIVPQTLSIENDVLDPTLDGSTEVSSQEENEGEMRNTQFNFTNFV